VNAWMTPVLVQLTNDSHRWMLKTPAVRRKEGAQWRLP